MERIPSNLIQMHSELHMSILQIGQLLEETEIKCRQYIKREFQYPQQLSMLSILPEFRGANRHFV